MCVWKAFVCHLVQSVHSDTFLQPREKHTYTHMFYFMLILYCIVLPSSVTPDRKFIPQHLEPGDHGYRFLGKEQGAETRVLDVT